MGILPTASPITLTIVFALSSTNSSTLLTERVPLTQLLANIVGLSGLLGVFGMSFGLFEAACAQRKGANGAVHPADTVAPMGEEKGGGGADGGNAQEVHPAGSSSAGACVPQHDVEGAALPVSAEQEVQERLEGSLILALSGAVEGESK